MEILIVKSPIPIIWLDTSVVIRLTKVKLGLPLSDLEKERFNKLYDLIYKKVREHKLLCPEGDQDEEIQPGQSLIKECQGMQATLGLGISFDHRFSIQRSQLFRVMKAHVEKKRSLTLNYKDVFHRDPIKELSQVGNFIISVNHLTPQEELNMQVGFKKATLEQLEELRRKKVVEGITFQQQLEDEYTGIVQAGEFAIRKWIDKAESGIEPTLEDYFQLEILSAPLTAWKRYGGRPEGLEGLLGFIFSDDYKSIPHIEISCKLWAKLITSPNPIESGDMMDNEQLSTIIPYCDFVIADRKMKNRIVDLGIDQKYNTKVFSMRDFDRFIEELEQL